MSIVNLSAMVCIPCKENSKSGNHVPQFAHSAWLWCLIFRVFKGNALVSKLLPQVENPCYRSARMLSPKGCDDETAIAEGPLPCYNAVIPDPNSVAVGTARVLFDLAGILSPILPHFLH